MPSNFLDQVILVDENDNQIGVMDKVEAHRGEAKLHRAISVFLFNEKGELLLQQRSAHKIVGAGEWANTCCGNLRPGESYEECADRRLDEELRIKKVELKPIYKFQYHVKCNEEFSEWEMDQIFLGKYEGEVKPNPEEVNECKWIEIRKIQFDDNETVYAPWLRLILKDEVFQSEVKKFLQKNN
jgi:isopentenyl-diphosphate delta-isomerase